jgi:hypothetical protein
VRIHRPRKSRDRVAVTAVIPCYNYGKYLSEVVQSVLSQEHVDVRVIIVDDASTDRSAVIAGDLASEDSRITVIVHPDNQGHIATYNDGLARVTTPYCMLLSADDLLAPQSLARATDLMVANPRVGMVYGRPVDFTDNDREPDVPKTLVSTWTVWGGHEWIRLASIRGRCFILSPEVIMRTAAMREIGYYNPQLPHSGDLEYWLRMASRWDIGRINGPAQAFYRVHGTNMHLVSFSSIATDLSHRQKAFQVLCTPAGPKDREYGRAMNMRARRALAREALILAQRELDSGGNRKNAVRLAEVATAANQAAEGSLRYRIFRCQLQRSEAGRTPGFPQKLAEFSRSQIDRMRWRIWKAVGIS